MKERKRDYIFKRSNSQFWRVRFQMGGRSVEKSLGTTDHAQAEILALPLIGQHKAKLLEARPRLEASWWHQHEPGRKHIVDGKEVIATERELLYLNNEGVIVERKPNGGPAHKLLNAPMDTVLVGDNSPPFAELRRKFKGATFIDLDRLHRGTVPVKSGDDVFLETYLKHANITGHFEREARNVWALYMTLTNNKPLKDADRDDGRKLVAHFEGEGLKSATIEKKIGWLNAMVNLAIKEGRLKFNPFSSIVPKRDDKQRRLPLTDADMKECKLNLDKLSASDQLLFRVLATTGMRLSEAFEIEGEEKEKDCRYVIVGKKTEQSLRRVPLPTAVLQFLPKTPKTITSPLFPRTTRDPPDAASKRLSRFLDDCGIVDRAKVVHSLRHRAQDRLRAAGCPQDIRWAILGHEEKTVAAGYGEGFPVPLLKKWIDRIGF
jgi:integrase